MNLQNEIKKLELELMSSIVSRDIYKRLAQQISKVQEKSISKKSLLELFSSSEKQNLEKRIRLEGALEFARKLAGEAPVPKKKTAPVRVEEEDEEGDNDFEDEEESEDSSLDDNIKSFYGLGGEEEEDENE